MTILKEISIGGDHARVQFTVQIVSITHKQVLKIITVIP